MRFNLIDRIIGIEAGRSLKAVKLLTLGEEYLADHFPGFPVMPGVLMLQTLVEAGSWLLRLSEEFRHSIIVLRDTKNVKYGTFMEPGKALVISVEMTECDARQAVFRGKGEVEGNSAVSARFVLDRYNLRDRDPRMDSADARLIQHYRDLALMLDRRLVQESATCA
jgi:3-hydroxyacyl-[acyl-carrier-protein] dehydratase